MPHLPHSHKCHASLHSHTHGVLCVAPPIHSHTHWLADCPHALHTPPPLGVRVLIHLLSSATHTHTGRTGVAHAWVVAGVVTTTTPLVPHHHTHTHSGTGGVGHGGAWWCACALCVPPTPPSHSPSLPPPPTLLCHHRPHTHTGLGACTTATHTRHMHHHTHQGVLCVDHTMPHPPPPTPSPHSHTHTPHVTHTRHQPHCHNGACHRSPRRPHSHTTDATHTHHTGDRPRPSTPLAVAFREPPPPRWSCPFALLSSSLLVHHPLFSLSLKHALTRPSCAHHHHHAIHPVCVRVCVVGMDSTKHHSGGEARHSHAC